MDDALDVCHFYKVVLHVFTSTIHFKKYQVLMKNFNY